MYFRHSIIFHRYAPLFALLFAFAFCGAAHAGETSAADLESRAETLRRAWDKESARAAIEAFDSAAEAWERDGNPVRAAACLRRSGQIRKWFGEFDAAFKSLRSALERAKSSSDATAEAGVLAELVRMSVAAGDYAGASKYSKAASDAAARSGSETARADVLLASGEFNYWFGRPADAVRDLAEAARLADEIGMRETGNRALVLLAYAYMRSDDPVTALQTAQNALERCEADGDRRGTALALYAVSFIYGLTGETSKSLDHLKRMEKLLPDGLDFYVHAQLSIALATIYRQYGDAVLDETYLMRALGFYEEANSPPGRLTTMITVALVLSRKGDRAGREEMIAKAERLARETNDSFHQAMIADTLAEFAMAEGRFDIAIGHLERAESILRPRKIRMTKIENALGLAYFESGDRKRARRFIETALATNRRIKDSSNAAVNLFYLAKIAKAEGDVDGALASIRESLGLSEAAYSNVVNGGMRSNYLSAVYERYELGVELLMEKSRRSGDRSFAVEALRLTEMSRARGLVETLRAAEADLSKAADPALLKKQKELKTLLAFKSDSLTDLLANGAPAGEIETMDRQIADLNHELDEVRATLKEASPGYSSIVDPEAFDIAAFQKRYLADGSLLLEFALGTERSYLWAVDSDGIATYELPPRAEIESAVGRLRVLLATQGTTEGLSIEEYRQKVADAEREFDAGSAELSKMLFSNVKELTPGRRLIVVPDGKLQYFPLSALPAPSAADGEPLLVSNQISYQPSAQTLQRLSRSATGSDRGPGEILVIADPVFNKSDPRLSAVVERSENRGSPDRFRFAESLAELVRLPASETEGREIVEQFGSRNSTLLSGFEASRANLLRQEMSRYRIIHFSTHAIINELRPELSGIALAGFKSDGTPVNQLVRLQDIYDLGLDADLVVLSACETAVGKDVRGEGLRSLNTAFLSAGAKTVVASLWKVEDTATLKLMGYFYDSLGRNAGSTSQALRDAQLALRQNERFRSPFYWASFTVVGDYETVPRIRHGISGMQLIVGAVAAASVIGLILFIGARRRRGRP